MEELERFRMLAGVFREMPREFNGLQVHPLTAGRWDLLRQRENQFLFSGEDPEEREPAREEFASEADYSVAKAAWILRQSEVDGAMMFAICEFLWVHTAPIGEVLRADADAAEWKQAVKGFAIGSAGLPEVIEFMLSFRDQAQRLAAAMVEPDPDDDAEGGDDAPGKDRQSHTGSRPMSGVSGATSLESGASGSCGDSPSPKGCSMSTARTGKMIGVASGAGNQGIPAMPVEKVEQPPHSQP